MRAAWLLLALAASGALSSVPLHTARGEDAPSNSADDTVASAARREFRVRLAWGGGQPLSLSGTVRLSQGELAEPRALGIEVDEPGSMWLDGGQLGIEPRRTRTFDGVDLTVRAPLDAKLLVSLADAQTETRIDFDVPLSELLREPAARDLDSTGNRMVLRRAPGDLLHVRLLEPALVYRPGETVAIEVEPRLFGAEATGRARVRLQLRDAQARNLWTSDAEVSLDAEGGVAAPTAFECPLPESEGVYDLEFELSTARVALAPVLKQVVASRRVQVVVIAEHLPEPAGNSAAPTLVSSLDPAHPRWRERIAQVPGLTALRRGPWGTPEARILEHPLGVLLELPAAAAPGGPSWQAYPLQISEPGQPHVIEVDFAGDVPQSVGLSVVEPSAAGGTSHIGLDSGFFTVTESPAGDKLLTHRLLCWPRTETPLLLVTNRSAAASAVYGTIRVRAYTSRLDVALAEDRSPARAGAPRRLLAGYLDRPLFAENFGAAETLDPPSGRSLDDWNTFYQGGTRLADYLRHEGFNAALVSVWADASAVYPSALLEATPRYDTGTFFSSGQDPVRKDVLELLFRLFDRANLTLVPTLHFTAPLPQLEALRRRGGRDAVGLELVDRDGRRARTQPSAAGRQGPGYNALDPRVQTAMLEVVGELVDRYAAHPSFGGLAVALSADGCAQLPGLDWGYDDATISRFEQATGLELTARGTQRFAQRAALLNGQHRQTWVDWRVAMISDFYRRAERRVASAHPGARVYLASIDPLGSDELQAELRPTLPPRKSIEEALREAGIDPDLGAKIPGVVLLRPNYLEPPGSVARQAIALRVNEAADLDRRVRAASIPGSLFFHPPQRLRLTPTVERTPLGERPLQLVSQLVPAGAANRRRFVHSVAALDAQVMCDGGWLLGLGQESALSEVIATYRRLPAVSFKTVPVDSQPVTVRTAVAGGRTYLYLANDSPWPVDVRLDLATAAPCPLQDLAQRRQLAAVENAGPQASWPVELEPWDLIAVSLPGETTSVRDVRVDVPDAARAELEARLARLQARAIALAEQPALDALENPSFEMPAAADGTISGWEIDPRGGVATQADTVAPDERGQVVRLHSAGGTGTVLRSAPLTLPDTGRLGIWVRLRTTEGSPEPHVRLAVEGRDRGRAYYRYAVVGHGESVVRLSPSWQQFYAQFDDLPLSGLDDLRVRFELRGPGEVWLDDVALYALQFADNERVELFKIITSAQLKLQNGAWTDCLRLLDSYWPRYLEANVVLSEAQLAERTAQRPRPSAPAAQTPPPAEADRGGVLRRIQSWLPSRFFR
ncbi:MAG: family 10 glycosylhydrolase [Pirellulales bacterium]|nr:family 10 glycosylhydrolase [Pirellulales bacterium]